MAQEKPKQEKTELDKNSHFDVEKANANLSTFLESRLKTVQEEISDSYFTSDLEKEKAQIQELYDKVTDKTDYVERIKIIKNHFDKNNWVKEGDHPQAELYQAIFFIRPHAFFDYLMELQSQENYNDHGAFVFFDAIDSFVNPKDEKVKAPVFNNMDNGNGIPFLTHLSYLDNLPTDDLTDKNILTFIQVLDLKYKEMIAYINSKKSWFGSNQAEEDLIKHLEETYKTFLAQKMQSLSLGSSIEELTTKKQDLKTSIGNFASQNPNVNWNLLELAVDRAASIKHKSNESKKVDAETASSTSSVTESVTQSPSRSSSDSSGDLAFLQSDSSDSDNDSGNTSSGEEKVEAKNLKTKKNKKNAGESLKKIANALSGNTPSAGISSTASTSANTVISLAPVASVPSSAPSAPVAGEYMKSASEKEKEKEKEKQIEKKPEESPKPEISESEKAKQAADKRLQDEKAIRELKRKSREEKIEDLKDRRLTVNIWLTTISDVWGSNVENVLKLLGNEIENCLSATPPDEKEVKFLLAKFEKIDEEIKEIEALESQNKVLRGKNIQIEAYPEGLRQANLSHVNLLEEEKQANQNISLLQDKLRGSLGQISEEIGKQSKITFRENLTLFNAGIFQSPILGIIPRFFTRLIKGEDYIQKIIGDAGKISERLKSLDDLRTSLDVLKKEGNDVNQNEFSQWKEKFEGSEQIILFPTMRYVFEDMETVFSNLSIAHKQKSAVLEKLRESNVAISNQNALVIRADMGGEIRENNTNILKKNANIKRLIDNFGKNQAQPSQSTNTDTVVPMEPDQNSAVRPASP